MKTIEYDARLPVWLNAALNSWPLCLDADRMRSLFAFAWDNQGPYLPPDASLYMNGFVMFRVTSWYWLPLGFWLHLKPTRNLRFQTGAGWKGNGRFGLTFRFQTDAQAAKGVSGPNYGQAKGWGRGTA